MPRRLPGGGRLCFLILLVLFGSVLGPGETRAQAPSSPDTVAAVQVDGNVTVDSELILRGFGLVVGDRYSLDSVRRGIRRLYDLGFFSDITILGDIVPGGVALTVRVVENPRVSSVEFTGNDKIKEKDLLERLGPVKGKMADDRLMATVERKLAAVYREKGYSQAVFRTRYLPGDTDSRRILLVEVDEKEKIRVEKIRFEGLNQLEPGNLRGPMKQGTTGFLRGGVLKPQVLEDDMPRIEDEMHRRGFRDGEVLGYDVLPGSREGRVVVEIRVEEGQRYYFGAVKWEGSKVLPTPLLYALTEVEPGNVYNQEKVRTTVSKAYEAYADRGYLYVNVQPDETVADSTVNLDLRIIEGEPSNVHDIIITGNTRTKERVIRRQLFLRPGDRFRRNALVRSNRELQQLGYFSDIQVDSRPVPGSNDIDLVMTVEEKQVGTASAGFGFSSSVGLTGFMELGHSNLFGNGQSLQLRMERGRRRNNAELSLTEPWFLGTPTSVGIDLFSTNRIYRGPDLDLEIRQAGGALRVGRPLPIPYVRLFATYRLESQKVVDETDLDDNESGTRSFLTGFRLDQETSLSSSIAFSLVRNSTDHPIYPTLGSNARLRTEFSGGFMGGDQVFQKYELDVSRYLRTINLGGWRPILMLRSRLGAVGELFRDDDLIPTEFSVEEDLVGAIWDTVRVGNAEVFVPVPSVQLRFPPESNELFRMGGTTFNALRGYDDFEIVPRDNVTQRFLVTEFSDSTGTRYEVRPGTVFYPGGKYMLALTAEYQFTVADPLHALFFFDVGGTWNEPRDFRWDSLHRGLGFGLRMEVPLLGLIGFDYGYGFDRLDRRTGVYNLRSWEPHIQFGRIF